MKLLHTETDRQKLTEIHDNGFTKKKKVLATKFNNLYWPKPLVSCSKKPKNWIKTTQKLKTEIIKSSHTEVGSLIMHGGLSVFCTLCTIHPQFTYIVDSWWSSATFNSLTANFWMRCKQFHNNKRERKQYLTHIKAYKYILPLKLLN